MPEWYTVYMTPSQPTPLKTCMDCGASKPVSQFSTMGQFGRRPSCKPCHALRESLARQIAAQEVAGTITAKTCWRCRMVLPIEGFSWKPRSYLGRYGACDNCRSPQGTKRCLRCSLIKPKTQFGLNRRQNGFQANCKSCTVEANRDFRLAQFRLTADQYESMLAIQGNRCAICRKQPKRFAIDHDHSCCPQRKGACGNCIRGLLCDGCNLGLGCFLDDPGLLAEAIAYLESSRKVSA